MSCRENIENFDKEQNLRLVIKKILQAYYCDGSVNLSDATEALVALWELTCDE